jgi:hypothetical protein
MPLAPAAKAGSIGERPLPLNVSENALAGLYSTHVQGSEREVRVNSGASHFWGGRDYRPAFCILHSIFCTLYCR